jgi:hypothetical protein
LALPRARIFAAVLSDLSDVPQFSELSYEQLSVGDRWGPFVESLDQDTSDGLRGAIGSSAPGDGAPLGVLPLITLRVLRRALRGLIPGGVLARQTFSVLHPLPAAGPVFVEVSVNAQQRRPSGFYTTFLFVLSHEELAHATVEWMILAPKREGEPA